MFDTYDAHMTTTHRSQQPASASTVLIGDAGGTSGQYADSQAARLETAGREGNQAIDAAMLRMAQATGAEVRERSAWPGSTLTVRFAAPQAGIRFALMLRDSTESKPREYVRLGRQDGMTWHQIGEALNLTPRAQERGMTRDDAAFHFAADAEHVGGFQTLTFGWTCPVCQEFILDRGVNGGHPEDEEPGHAPTCARLAAMVAEYDARWADE